MRLRLPIVSLLAFGCLASIASAQMKPAPKPGAAAITATEDEAGCKDSALLARVPGCKILQCSAKPEDAVDVTIGGTLETGPKTVEVDGASEVIYYLCNAKDAAVEIAPTLEAALVKDSYQIAFSGKDKDDDNVVSARKYNQWVEISTYVYNGQPAYVQTALKTEPEEFSSADDFEEQFPAVLRVALPKVKFAAGKAVIAPAGEKVLAEIAAVLAKKVDWKVRVDAFAAEAATPAANVELSKARATAIVDWLAAHGVEKTRLEAVGVGDTVPIPDGKQRVELVRM